MRYLLALALLLTPVGLIAAPSQPSTSATTFKSKKNKEGKDRKVKVWSSPVTQTTKKRTHRKTPAARTPRPKFFPKVAGPATPIRASGPSAAKAAVVFNMSLEKVKAATLTLNQAKQESEPGRKRALFLEARREFQNAILGFEEAVAQDPEMVGAWNELGYSRRKLGNYEGALSAYSKALKLDPDYLPAIEYQAEAHLGLNRLEEAKQAYMRLFREDRKLAAELKGAMVRWVSSRSQDPKGVSPQAVTDFSEWVKKRTQLASQVAPGTDGKTSW